MLKVGSSYLQNRVFTLFTFFHVYLRVGQTNRGNLYPPEERDNEMEEAFVVYLDEDPVTFTDDGRVSVLDAIRMVLDSSSAPAVWEKMKKEHPDILHHCQDRAFEEQGTVSVIDKEGWEKIWMILPEYFFDSAPVCE
jgi:hypothetical protein